MIKINELYKSFGKNKILEGLNFSINKGECICIIGKSGIGKSILLKHMIGLMKPDIGEIWIDERMINGLNLKELSATFE